MPAPKPIAPPLTYKDAGVDIEAGDALVKGYSDSARRTRRPELVAGIGGFAALFRLDLTRFKRPVLVASTDGVGTKLMLAFATGNHRTVGIDLVAMCVNDLITCGAEPLLFLDYYATGRLDPATAQTVVAGIAEGCVQAGCALAGGETAEMPGMYAAGHYDLAGFAVGCVDDGSQIDGATIVPGDVLIGFASSGVHSNGFSLVRRIVADRLGNDWSRPFAGGAAGEVLLTPTRIYVALSQRLRPYTKGLAHITGGGLAGNLVRILPPGIEATVDTATWPAPAVFAELQALGNIPETEMFRTFNMGIGLVAVVAPENARAAMDAAQGCGIEAWPIGTVRAAGHTLARIAHAGRTIVAEEP